VSKAASIEFLDEPDPSTGNGRVGFAGDPSGIDAHEDPGSVALTEVIEARGIPIQQALDHYEFVDANAAQGYIILADRRHSNGRGGVTTFANPDTSNISTAELGSAAPSPWTAWTREEHVSELRGREGLTKYYRMKRNDGIVRGTLRSVKTPLLTARWFMKPGTTSAADRKIAAFVQQNLFEDLNTTWFNLLNDILLCIEYGYMPFEKVYDAPVLEGGKFVQKLRKLAPRHPMDVQKWEYDANGGPDAVWMESAISTPTEPGVRIPISKMAIFSLEAEAGDLQGISVLRSAYKHWYYKDTLYKIDAIQKERHGVGIPVIKLPMGYSKADKKAAEDLGRNLRTNERSHMVLPPGWEVLFAKVEGQMVDCMKSIEHHDMAIMANVLSSWLKEPSAKAESVDMFMKSTRYIAAMIMDIMNRFVIKELVDLNFRLGPNRKYPKLVARRIGEENDARTNSFSIRNLVGAGAIEPDDVMEEYLREELDLPPKDFATARKMITEPNPIEDEEDVDGEQEDDPDQDDDREDSDRQRGARAGRARQQPTPPRGAGRSNTGVDRSGG
jgi:hypothetical protein